MATIEHHERPEYLNRLAMLRDQVFVLDHMYMSLFSTCGWILRLGVTVALLMSIHPALALLAVFALPTVLTSAWRPGVERAAAGAGRAGEPAGAAPVRDGHHGPARQGGARDRHRRSPGRPTAARRGNAGTGPWPRRGGRAPCGTRWRGRSSAPGSSAPWRSSSFVVHATPGNVLLVLAAGSRLSAYIGATVGEIGFLRGIWLDGSRRLAWLEDYAAALVEHCRRAGARAALGRDSLRARLLRLSRHGAPRARGRLPGSQSPAPWWPSWARTAPARPRS